MNRGFPGGSVVKNLPANVREPGDMGQKDPLGQKDPQGGNGNPHHYSCLENSMDGRAWWATAHRVAESQARLK